MLDKAKYLNDYLSVALEHSVHFLDVHNDCLQSGPMHGYVYTTECENIAYVYL